MLNEFDVDAIPSLGMKSSGKSMAADVKSFKRDKIREISGEKFSLNLGETKGMKYSRI